jgi:hypothetical protein
MPAALVTIGVVGRIIRRIKSFYGAQGTIRAAIKSKDIPETLTRLTSDLVWSQWLDE